MFIWSEDELNPEQSTAVHHDGNVLLVACPGSGKTRTLTYKIAYELSKLEDDRKYIIAITYTNRAADEIKDRIQILGVDVRQLWIGTIHSFCLEWIIKPYSLYDEDLKNGFKVINSHDSEELLIELCARFEGTNISQYDCEYIATPDGLVYTCQIQNKQEGVEWVLERYFENLRLNSQVDFELILYHAFSLLKNNVSIRKVLSNIFGYVLVDEYQDTKEIQYHILCMLINCRPEKVSSFIVGDPNQSIFQTLGGYAIKRGDLERLSNSSFKELHLIKNYRSSEAIVEYFDHFKTFDNRITACGEFKEFKSLISHNSLVHRENLLDEVANLILKNINEYSIKPDQICVIAPWWTHLAGLTRNLMVRLPNISFDGPGMAPFSRDIENFWFRLSRIVLTKPSPELYVRRIRWASEVLNDLKDTGCSIDLDSKSFLRLCNSIELDEINGLSYLEQYFEKILHLIDVEIKAHSMLLEHYESFFESSKKRIERLKKEGQNFIEGIENFRNVFNQNGGVSISTIHSVKGAEFDTVIAFGLLEGFVPHFSDVENGRENAKKLLYVIGSRARKNLHLISEQGHGRYPYEKVVTQELAEINFQYSEI